MGKLDKFKGCIRGSALTLCIVAGVVTGISLGIILRNTRSEKFTQREVVYVKFVGDLFLRTLKALILPLIVSSLVTAIGSLDLSLSGKIGSRALLYYMFTTVCAVTQGIILVVVIGPGRGADLGVDSECTSKPGLTVDTLMDLIRNVFPPNLVQATMQGTQTVLMNPDTEILKRLNDTALLKPILDYSEVLKRLNDTELLKRLSYTELPTPLNYTELLKRLDETSIPIEEWPMKFVFVDGMNLMGLVAFATVLGITLGKLGPKGKPLLDFFAALAEAMMILTSKVVLFSPIAICSLVTAQLLEINDAGKIFKNLGWYFGTVLTGLMIHGFIVVPSIYAIVTKKMPFEFIANMTQAIATAFGTASSSATLPVTINCLEEKNHVDPHVSRFVLPIGATINMDGTALYLPVGAIYIAQLCGMQLTLGNIIAISLISTTTSIGAAGIPQIGMVIMITVLNSVGLPTDYVAYIMPVDWLLERFRTAVNIMGDSFGAGCVHHLSKDELAHLPKRSNPLQVFENAEKEEENAVNFAESKI